MSKNKKLIIAIIVIVVVVFLWALIRGPEDTWICVDDEWVKHGVPYAPKPEGQCNWLDNLNPFR